VVRSHLGPPERQLIVRSSQFVAKPNNIMSYELFTMNEFFRGISSIGRASRRWREGYRLEEKKKIYGDIAQLGEHPAFGGKVTESN
jgi:hypothetical protein